MADAMQTVAVSIVAGAFVTLLVAAALHAVLPGLAVLSGASLAGILAVSRRPADDGGWLSVQLLLALTLVVFAWTEREQIGPNAATLLISVAVAFACLSTLNYRRQRRLVAGRRRSTGRRR